MEDMDEWEERRKISEPIKDQMSSRLREKFAPPLTDLFGFRGVTSLFDKEKQEWKFVPIFWVRGGMIFSDADVKRADEGIINAAVDQLVETLKEQLNLI